LYSQALHDSIAAKLYLYPLSTAYDRALAFMDNGELPPSWDKEELLGLESEEEEEVSDVSIEQFRLGFNLED